jgi:hypothetical protein
MFVPSDARNCDLHLAVDAVVSLEVLLGLNGASFLHISEVGGTWFNDGAVEERVQSKSAGCDDPKGGQMQSLYASCPRLLLNLITLILIDERLFMMERLFWNNRALTLTGG